MDRAPLLTADELTAIARSAGVAGFPSVGTTLYDAVAPELRALLDERLQAALVARGVLVPDGDGELYPVPELDAVLAAAFRNQVYVSVGRLAPAPAPGEFVTVGFLAGSYGVVRHDAAEPFHSLSLEPSTLSDLLCPLVAADAPGPVGQGRHRGRLSGLADLVPAPEAGWRRITALTRTDEVGDGVRVEAFLAVLDGGPGGLWLATEDAAARPDPDRPLLAEPASAEDVRAAIEAFAAEPVEVTAR